MMFLVDCPDCDARYFGVGDFFNDRGQIIRLATIQDNNCQRCQKIGEIVGLEACLGVWTCVRGSVALVRRFLGRHIGKLCESMTTHY